MSVGIIMKESQKFQRHTNRELRDPSGRPMKFHSEKDYTNELKSRGLEPYREGAQNTYKKKEYKGVSDEARRMMNSVTYTNGKPNIGGRYIEALKQMGVREVPKEIRNRTSGGMY